MPLAPVKEWTRETLYQDVKFCCSGGAQVCSKGKNVCHENNQVEVNLINAPLWLFLFLQIDRKWNFREKMWAITPKVWPLKCACVYELKDTEKTLICRHTQLRIILGCGPNTNLKSTNTHGTQQREKETEQGEASGYYAWTEVLCCCILKCGLGPVTDTMWTANVSLIGPKWNKVQMALIDNIRLGDTFQFVSLSICVPLSHSHTFSSSVLYFFTLLAHFIHLPFLLHILSYNIQYTYKLSPFLYRDHHFLVITIIPELIDTPLHPTVFSILIYLSATPL